jgi:ribosomal protein L11 methyltransferase
MLEGLPPNGAAHVMRLDCDEATARHVVDVIVESFDPAETAAAAFETPGTSPPSSPERTTSPPGAMRARIEGASARSGRARMLAKMRS